MQKTLPHLKVFTFYYCYLGKTKRKLWAKMFTFKLKISHWKKQDTFLGKEKGFLQVRNQI